jgi:hypothetical protein
LLKIAYTFAKHFLNNAKAAQKSSDWGRRITFKTVAQDQIAALQQFQNGSVHPRRSTGN